MGFVEREYPETEMHTEKTPRSRAGVSSDSRCRTEKVAQQQIDNAIAKHFIIFPADFITNAVIIPPADWRKTTAQTTGV